MGQSTSFLSTLPSMMTGSIPPFLPSSPSFSFLPSPPFLHFHTSLIFPHSSPSPDVPPWSREKPLVRLIAPNKYFCQMIFIVFYLYFDSNYNWLQFAGRNHWFVWSLPQKRKRRTRWLWLIIFWCWNQNTNKKRFDWLSLVHKHNNTETHYIHTTKKAVKVTLILFT